MTEQIARMLAFLFMASVVGLLEIAVARAFARAFREVRQDVRAWRDKRALRAYEADFAHLDEHIRRGER